MGILSYNFSLTILICFLYIRLSPYFSLSQKWLNGLEYCWPPPDADLQKLNDESRPLKSKATQPSSSKKSKKSKSAPEPVPTPESTPSTKLELRAVKIQDGSLVQHTFWNEFDQIVLMFVCVVINFLVSEFLNCYINDRNAVVTAIFIFSAGYAFKVLLSAVTRVGLDSSDVKLALMSIGIFFSFAWLAISMPDWLVDFQIKDGYEEFLHQINTFLDLNQDPLSKSSFEPSFTVYAMILCATAAFMSGILFYPTLRFARCHLETFLYTGKEYHKTLSRIALWSPLLILTLWIKPFSSDLLVPHVVSLGTFEVLRVYSLIAFVILRMSLLRPYMQSYLATAIGWARLFMTENIDYRGTTIKYKVLSIYSYLCVAAVQILAPCLAILTFAFIIKMRGLYMVHMLPSVCMPPEEIATTSNVIIFTGVVFKSVFGFLSWWILFTTVLVSVFDLVYEKDKYLIKEKSD